ncbi:MAG TPA: hypothetical protein VHX60_18295 [Acidobacteriaceae bacterium]|jgi:hypothetical protein|nr:hypothetical protein [Acidobacteriaceae bacterium]
MKASVVLIAFAALAVAAPAQTPAEPGNSATANATVQAQEAVGVPAELSKRIDSKDAKVGAEVEAKTAADARLADGTRLPRGTRLVGHITDVTPKSHDSHDGRVAFTFDHAVLRDGHEVAIHAWMQALSAPAPIASNNDDMIGGSGAGGAGMGGSPGGGGGMMGGSQASGARGNTGPGGMVNNTPGGALGQPGSAGSGAGPGPGAGDASGLPGGNPSGPGANSGLGPRGQVRNLPGVIFWTASVSGSGPTNSTAVATATVLNAQGKNVTLDGGSQMMLAVIPQPATPAQ